MKSAIWKFALKTMIEQSIEMPENAQLLSVQVQSRQPCIWGVVNPYNENSKRIFYTFGISTDLPEANLKYVGTYQM